MLLFYVTDPLDVGVKYYLRNEALEPYSFTPAADGPPPAEPPGPAETLRLRLDAPVAGCLTDRTVYLANSPVFFGALKAYPSAEAAASPMRILARTAQAKLLGMPELPRRIGHSHVAGEPFVPLHEQLAPLGSRQTLRLAVVNIFHLAFGDTLLSLGVLRELHAVLAAHYRTVEIDLLQHRCNPEAEALALRSGLVRRVHVLPAPLTQLASYDAYFDVSGERVSTTGHWMDLCLEAFGLDPAAVPPARKRMGMPPVEEGVAAELAPVVAQARTSGAPLLLFHPDASAEIRSWPRDLAAGFVRQTIARTGWTVASTVSLAVDDPRFVDWSRASCSFQHFAHLVSQTDALVSVDTVAYHLADAFGVPGVAVFTSIDPAHRVAYYPFIEGIWLYPEDNPLLGMGISIKAEDIAAARAMWDRLDVDQVLAAVERMAARRRACADG